MQNPAAATRMRCDVERSRWASIIMTLVLLRPEAARRRAATCGGEAWPPSHVCQWKRDLPSALRHGRLQRNAVVCSQRLTDATCVAGARLPVRRSHQGVSCASPAIAFLLALSSVSGAFACRTAL